MKKILGILVLLFIIGCESSTSPKPDPYVTTGSWRTPDSLNAACNCKITLSLREFVANNKADSISGVASVFENNAYLGTVAMLGIRNNHIVTLDVFTTSFTMPDPNHMAIADTILFVRE